METNDLCAQCACLPVCGIYRVVGPMEKCHFYCQKKRFARWVKAECSEKMVMLGAQRAVVGSGIVAIIAPIVAPR